MKKYLLVISLISGLFFSSSCKKDKSPSSPQILTETLSGDISQDLTLDPKITYLLKGKVFVKGNAILTIPAGVTVEVEQAGDPASKSALVVSKGAKLNVNGTADMPVIFTSAAASKSPGDWIGIVLLGKAPTNYLNAHVKGLSESADTEFGGTISDDNSGSMKYLRVEYAGGLNPAKEEEWELDMASGLSLEGVGSGTEINHIFVGNSRDDGFQFVGGTVNAKYLISYNNGDDNFDFDRGYVGKLQFLIGYHKSGPVNAIRGNGMESLNDKNASDILPYTRPIISNMTLIGPEGTDLSTNQSQGIYIRRNTRFLVRNSIIAGYSNGGLMLCPKTKPLLLNNAGSQFKFNFVNSDDPARAFTYDNGPSGIDINPDPQVAAYATEMEDITIEKPSVNKNRIVAIISDFKFKGLYISTPDLTPEASSSELNGADFSDPEYAGFFTQVVFRGAMDVNNWASGNWVNWK
jgi:hypothetical protein